MIAIRCALLLAVAFVVSGWSQPDWGKDATIPVNGRKNIYQFDQQTWPKVVREGRIHALNYPVTVTGVSLPYDATRRFLDGDSGNLLIQFFLGLFQGFSQFSSFDGVQEWLGLHEYPEVETEDIPFKDKTRPEVRMGLTLMEQHGTTGFTISCAQCHSGNLFGTKVLGLTNRFPKANEAFVKGKKAAALVTPGQFQWATGATDEERAMFKKAKQSLRYVEGKIPVQMGLDTSLAQVSLSLSRRAKDEVATKDPRYLRRPRKERLRGQRADSKPAVWWNVKYKTRWLSDGSVVSGNPIYTNFLWNEIGRGTDLEELEVWLDQNPEIVRELTSAVFASEPPSFFDYFDAEDFDIEAAKFGQMHFDTMCAKCHGTYIKGWQVDDSLPIREQLQTVQVNYPQPTKVKDVGTDPLRWQGMTSLEQLNDLRISKNNGIVVEAQKGYVPPPLVGIWARWPYLHNNSVPTLCDLLTPARQRPGTFYMGEAIDPERHFDSDCNGYPRPAPEEWRRDLDMYFSVRKSGSSNIGHDEGIFVIDGKNTMTPQMRKDLVRFLQTL